jgi:malate dehydrogenase (oxaloacetate-decarboxylating)(NADP+)
LASRRLRVDLEYRPQAHFHQGSLADLIGSALGQQGVAPEAARQQIRMFDTQGLVVAGRPGLAAHKLPYAHKLPPSKTFNHLDLATEHPQIVAAIKDFKPTALIGVSTVGKLFSQQVVEAMSPCASL